MTQDMIEELIAPMRYQLAQSEKRTAEAERNYAGIKLEMSMIRERFAEIYSQRDPVNKIAGMNLNECAKLCAAAYYVVIGRLPEGGSL